MCSRAERSIALALDTHFRFLPLQQSSIDNYNEWTCTVSMCKARVSCALPLVWIQTTVQRFRYLCAPFILHVLDPLSNQGFAVGAVSLGLSLRLGLTLILFYKSSSVLTKVGFDRKSKVTADYKARQERNPPGVEGSTIVLTVQI